MAGYIAMGEARTLASETEKAPYAAKMRDEAAEVQEQPAREVAELALMLEHEGRERAGPERVAHGLAGHPTVFRRTEVQRSSDCHRTPAARRAATRSSSA